MTKEEIYLKEFEDFYNNKLRVVGKDGKHHKLPPLKAYQREFIKFIKNNHNCRLYW